MILSLGAVVEERVKPLVRDRYLDTFSAVADPIEGLKRMGARMQQELEKEGILLMGCPVNNLVTEMSGVDEGFRSRLAEILDEYLRAVESNTAYDIDEVIAKNPDLAEPLREYLTSLQWLQDGMIDLSDNNCMLLPLAAS